MYAKTIIVGRLGRDGELKYTPQGKMVVSFSVAVDQGWGENKHTVWYRCSLWGERAEKLAQYITKSKMVLVEGEIEPPHVYQDRSGEHRANLDLRVTDVRFLGGRSEDSESRATKEPAGDENIPF